MKIAKWGKQRTDVRETDERRETAKGGGKTRGRQNVFLHGK
jgi:hypothetical protein